MAAGDGGSAFPFQHRHGRPDGTETWSCEGMTLLDYFAARALQGILSDFRVIEMMSKGPMGPANEIASAAYVFARSMLKARPE